MEQGYSQREAAKISGVAQTKLSRLKKSGAISPDLPDGKYSASLIDKIRAEYGKPGIADDSPVDAQEAAQATEKPVDEQTPAADENANVAPVIDNTPAQVADFVSDNQSADVPVDGEKKMPAMHAGERKISL